MLIRLATEGDVEGIKDIEASLPSNQRAKTSITDTRDSKLTVVVVNNRIASYCVYSQLMGQLDITVERIATHPDYQRKGYAYELIAALKRKAKVTHHDCRIHAIVDDRDYTQRKFFSACGFELTEKRGTDIYLMEHFNPRAAIERIVKRRIK